MKLFDGLFKENFSDLLAGQEYEKAWLIYQETKEKKSLDTLWQEEYQRLIKQKKYALGLCLAEKFQAETKFLRSAATVLVLQALKRQDYKEVIRLLEKYPVKYLIAFNHLKKIEKSSDTHVQKILEALEDNIYHDVSSIFQLLDESYEKMMKNPYRQGYLLTLPVHSETLITGDLHGNRINLNFILSEARLNEYPNRHLIFQEVIHSRSLLIDQRDLSFLEVVDILKCLCQYPDRVHFLLGNHDLNFYLQRETLCKKRRLNHLFKRGLSFLFGKKAREIVEKYLRLIEAMPAAIQCGNLLLTHSNPEKEKQGFSSLKEKISLKKHSYIHSLVAGRDHAIETVESFLKEAKSPFSVIGHELCRLGYDSPNPRQLIIDSCHNKGRVILCRPASITSISDLKQSLHTIREQ